jgi:hypothetical protein
VIKVINPTPFANGKFNFSSMFKRPIKTTFLLALAKRVANKVRLSLFSIYLNPLKGDVFYIGTQIYKSL